MNIALIMGGYPPEAIGGAELQAQQLATELACRGHNVTVFTRRLSNSPCLEQRDGYLIRRRNVLPIAGLRMIWDTFSATWNILQQRPRPDVLFCYQAIISGIIGIVAQRLLGIPMILSVRGNEDYRISHPIYKRLIVPPVYKYARRVVVQSAHILKDMMEQLQLAGRSELASEVLSKTVVIPNGINPEYFQRSSGNKIIYVGRLIAGKGVADLINGMKELPEYELIIVGDGPERKHLEMLCRGMRVTFTGMVIPSQVREYLWQARILVLPSHLGDGLPNVIMEAMACGVPVIATRTAGIPDLVRHSETGFQFEIGDIGKMVSYMNCLMENDQLWKELSDQSIEAIQSFTWENVIPEIEQLLLDVVEKI